MTALRAWFLPHRIVLILLAGALVLWCAATLRWDWIPRYAPLAAQGLWQTLWLLAVSCILGFALAVPLGLAQAAGPWYLAAPARAFCTVIRGTPLLLQIWLLYYGLGSLFPQFPWIRQSELWPYCMGGSVSKTGMRMRTSTDPPNSVPTISSRVVLSQGPEKTVSQLGVGSGAVPPCRF